MKRRRLLKGLWSLTQAAVVGAFGFATFTGLRRAVSQTRVAPPAQHPLRPPGALPEAEFRAACTRCFLCGEVCVPECIQFPGRIEGAQPRTQKVRGIADALAMQRPVWHGGDTPYVLPWDAACSLCMRCGDVCPTGALVPIADDRDTIKREVRMGVAVLDRKVCLPWTRTSWCGACLTACPYRGEAITVDHQARPTIHEEHCIGCGLCVEVCPIRYKAIAVVPAFAPDHGRVRAE